MTFFRNALVRSQYENIPKGIHRTFEPLERFLNHAVFGTPADLRNRTLHIRWKDEKQISELNFQKPQNEVLKITKHQNDISKITKRQNDVFETTELFSQKLSIKEMAVMSLIMKNSKISISSLTKATGLSSSTIDRIIKSLKEKGVIQRIGSKNNSTWLVNVPLKQ